MVAAGAVPIAHANDGGGSIRIPAAVNGLVGLKPTRDRLAQDKMMRDMPVRIVSDGVLTRSVRDTAAFYREAEKVFRHPRLAPIGDITRPGRARLRIAVVTQGVGRDASPEVRELTLKTAALLESMGHRVEEIDPPVPDSFADDFLLYWGMLAMVVMRTGRRLVRAHLGPEQARQPHPRTRPARPPQPAPAARGDRRDRPQQAPGGAPPGDVRRHAHADAGHRPRPRSATSSPSADYDDIMDRLLDWVAFTPLQNATGEPAISLPLATTVDGASAGHDAGRRMGSRGPVARARLRARGGRSVAPDPGRDSGLTGRSETRFQFPLSPVYCSPSLPL